MPYPNWGQVLFNFIEKQSTSKQHLFYIKRIEQLLLFIEQSTLHDPHKTDDIHSLINPEIVCHFIQDIDRNLGLNSWQFRQLLHALKLFLISLYRFPWAKEFDWEYWYDASQKLPDNHATVARDYTESPTQFYVSQQSVAGSISTDHPGFA